MPPQLAITDKDLPMLSAVAAQALDLINRPQVTNAQITDLIQRDPALAGRVLHIANSAFYGGRFQARKIADAVVRMGLRQLRNILVVAATGELFDAKDPFIGELWGHSMAVATLTDKLASELGVEGTDDAFIAGLLHDIGKFIIHMQLPDQYGAALRGGEAAGKRAIDCEQAAFVYFDHATVGGIAVNKWKLASAVAECARMHHAAEDAVPVNAGNKPLVCLVSLANLLVHRERVGAGGTQPNVVALAAKDCARYLRLTPRKIESAIALANAICAPAPAPQPVRA